MKIGGLVLSGVLYRDMRGRIGGTDKGKNERLYGYSKLVTTY